MASFFRPPESLCYDNLQSMIANWKTWRKEFVTFMLATQNNDKPEEVKVHMFLNLIGRQGMELYESFTWHADGDSMVLNKVIARFDEHMKRNHNLTVNRFEFFSYGQKEGQSLDDYIKELIILRKECEFDTNQGISD